MSIDIKKMKAHFVRKEAPARPEEGQLSGGADIRDGHVLGLRFKPAPVFHFFGVWLFQAANAWYALWESDRRRARTRQTAGGFALAAQGVMFGE